MQQRIRHNFCFFQNKLRSIKRFVCHFGDYEGGEKKLNFHIFRGKIHDHLYRILEFLEYEDDIHDVHVRLFLNGLYINSVNVNTRIN